MRVLTVGLAALAVAIARGGFRNDPPPALLQAGEPEVLAPQAEKDPKNRTLTLQVVDRHSRAPIQAPR